MPKNLPALNNAAGQPSGVRGRPGISPFRYASRAFSLPLLPLVLFLAGTGFAYAQERILWYRSNSTGLALEMIPSRLLAMRNEYCLSVESIALRDLPAILLPYYENTFRIELRTIYKNGNEYRRQYQFRDAGNITRLTSSGGTGFFSQGNDVINISGDESSRGFIEIFNNSGYVTRELNFEEDESRWEYIFSYSDNTLLKAETWYKKPPEKAPVEEPAAGLPAEPVYTDYFRYTRSGSLRAIDRYLHEGAAINRLSFPRLGPGVSYTHQLNIPATTYVPEFLQNVNSYSGIKMSYTLDSRGRVLSEVWTGENDVPVGQFINTWSGDRLMSVHWKSDSEDKLVEYEYDSEGNSIAERNFSHGILERSLTRRNGRDVEEIFINGVLVLRAIWEDGVKISEERVPAGRGRN